MPPQIQALLQDKRLLAIIGGVLVLLIILGVVLFGRGGEKSGNPGDAELGKEQKVLAQVSSLGKAIEIQALLARQGIHVNYDDSGGEAKIKLLFDEHARLKDRDKALITLVQSGLMDNNVGLESFDKGDLTASREEKRIKLVRAQQGELARLIKKIDPIEDAAVSIAIPEQTLFRSDEKPMSASVQVSLPAGSILSRDKVQAITNLMVGSLQGLDSSRVAISDTNGHTYNSILDSSAEMNDRLQDQDNYMKQKVASQMDRLVGVGNYVVTVSTELRQAPRETMVQEFDPQGGVVSSKQSFNENLNSRGNGAGAAGLATSFLPNSMTSNANVNASNPNKDYLRNGVEVTYNNSKRQWVETSPVGMVEDITIAVTIDANHFPSETNLSDLQTLIARSASPKVRPENVSIVKTNMESSLPLSGSAGGHGGKQPVESPADFTWLYWAGGTIVGCLLLIVLLSVLKGGRAPGDDELLQARQALEDLRHVTDRQEAQIKATQEQTQLLLDAQQRQLTQQQPQMLGGGMMMESPLQHSQELSLEETLEELRDVVANDVDDDEPLDLEIKNWIEAS